MFEPVLERLEEVLPAAPGAWERSDEGGAVQYRLPGDDGICATAKVTARPNRLGEAAVRVDRMADCRSAGTTRHAELDGAVDAVAEELAAVLMAVDEP
jgi:hypothetical protein